MRLIWIIAVAILLSACSTRHDYTLPDPPADPVAFVERFIAEQPPKMRPQSVHATREYVEFGGVTLYSQPDLTGISASKQAVTRIYYDSIGRNELFSKRRWWIVRTRNKQGTQLADVWSDSREAALKYLAALDELQRQARK